MNLPRAFGRRRTGRERGSVLAIALLVSVFMLIIAVPFVTKFANRYRTAEKSYNSLAAQYLAEAGIERAIWEINYGNIGTWSGTSTQRTMAIANFAASNGTVVGDIAITVYNPGTVNPVIEATGSVVHIGTNKVTKTLRVVLQGSGSPPLFNYGIFGNTSVSMMNNSRIDSYDSRLGLYGGTNVHHNGDVGTNATGYGAISLINSSVVDGDATSGYQSDPNQAIQVVNSSSVTGQKTALTSTKTLPSVTPPVGLTSRGDYSKVGTSTTINASGQYGNFSLVNSAVVTVTADVTLYITGTFTLSNTSQFKINSGCSVTLYFGGGLNINNGSQINNLSKDPTKLMIFGTDAFTGAQTFANSADTYACIYTPKANLTLANGSTIYGAVTANTIMGANYAAIHYDEALGSVTPPFGGGASSTYSVKSWQEKII
ncbi:MAG: hypothetical protein ABSF88_10615 [Candidatus Aminicenantales bacterium]